MTTEEDLQRQLDADPTDWQTRMVLGDFLEETGDPRGPGYRALGMFRRVPTTYDAGDMRCAFHVPGCVWTYWYGSTSDCLTKTTLFADYLPIDWFLRCGGHNARGSFLKATTRRALDEPAGRGFAELPPESRAAILSLTQVILCPPL